MQPADGYGDYDDELIDEYPAEDFDTDDQLEAGMEIEIMDEENEVYEGTIIEITNDYIRVDFNDPLAGKVLTYDVQVVDVRPATEEELKMGFPASLLDEFDEHGHDGHNHAH